MLAGRVVVTTVDGAGELVLSSVILLVALVLVAVTGRMVWKRGRSTRRLIALGAAIVLVVIGVVMVGRAIGRFSIDVRQATTEPRCWIDGPLACADDRASL